MAIKQATPLREMRWHRSLWGGNEHKSFARPYFSNIAANAQSRCDRYALGLSPIDYTGWFLAAAVFPVCSCMLRA
ncbi:hypothetical protein SAMN06265374_2969 [Roseibium denhamense]|uniref:Uncharacterized protein n=1 Tax=Roseibium denhamense TaxID=76305 RepID=A0ABY1P812_9HYPH|nr:hypothetical protein SAMN06265374_2969 [Roseibium denhamense]